MNETVNTGQPVGSETMSPALPLAINYHLHVYNKVKPFLGQRIWEIGCGYGQYTDFLIKEGRQVLVTDIDTALIETFAAAQSDHSHLTIGHIDLENTETLMPYRSWNADSILCLNVLEHILRDCEALKTIGQIVAPGCVAVFLTPAFNFLYGFMDKEAGHYRRYTRHSLSSAFANAGWQVNKSFYINPVGAMGWLYRNRIVTPKTLKLADADLNKDILFFDRYLVPTSKMLEPVTASFFGQSVIVVATKTV